MTLLLAASSAVAQSAAPVAENNMRESNDNNVIAEASLPAAPIPQNDDDRVLGQNRRGGRDPRLLRRPVYHREDYRSHWAGPGNPAGTLIGAAIGFGLGAGVGAANIGDKGTTRGSQIVIGGLLLGFLGGCVGHIVPNGHSARLHLEHRTGEEDDEVARGPKDPQPEHVTP
jgi:hypothetical protein